MAKTGEAAICRPQSQVQVCRFSANRCLSLIAAQRAVDRRATWEVKRQNWLIGARRDADPGSRTAANIVLRVLNNNDEAELTVIVTVGGMQDNA